MQKIDLKKKKILVVEDEERNWFVLRDIIQFCNGEAIWAESGMEGIEKVKADKDISLVFMDQRLPFMKGSDATREIKTLRSELPVIAQTAFSEAKDFDDCKDAGCDEFLYKPLQFNKVVEVLSRYIA